MRKYLYLIILCVAFAGCKGSQQKGHTAESNGKESVANSDGKPAVTVTIPPYKFFVDKIAGDKVDVNVMVSNGNNPETYEPYAQQMMELSRSALYLKVGSIGFEQTWMKKLQDNAPDMKVIDTSTGITPAKTPGGNTDPHVWMSCKNARIISSNIFKALCNLEPKNKAFFEKNYLSLLKIIDKRDSTYFARDYQLEQLAIEEEGREPSASQLKSLIERARKEKIKFCLIQAEFANRNTNTFINESHTKPMNINPLQGDWNWAMQEAAAAVQGKKIVVGK